ESYNPNELPVRKVNRSPNPASPSRAIGATLFGAGIVAVGVFLGFASVAEIVSHSHAANGPALVGLFGGVCATGLGGGIIANAKRK
ncbi:MAG: hypothetical protein H7Z43_04430, partial [Clostridia bacterium]|nr:hypothetical protein [Deltaproteobacteria bacterium]